MLDEAELWTLMGTIQDPEIPVLTLVDLGVIRHIRIDDTAVNVGVAPTYSGCPATEVIEASVIQALQDNGVTDASVERVLSPPWTSDWLSDTGREKLREYGIAPPAESTTSKRSLLAPDIQVACPRCATTNTEKVSEFGSTPCKASYKCRDCLEPFEYFKCI